MPAFLYRDRDYHFGQQILSLRTASNLTQSGLADLLGISRQAVVGWESGASYPSPQHLKHLIALYLQHNAFHRGQEAEEIRALWQHARVRVALDETWLAGLLQKPDAGGIADPLQADTDSHPLARLVDWGDAPEVASFYGRQSELALLTDWLVEQHCRVLSILGMGGIGKSALAVTLMHGVAEQFDVVIWRSLRDAPLCETLLDELVRHLAGEPLPIVPDTLERRLNLLFESLRTRRVLLVVDNLESVMETAEGSGRMLPGYEGYERLLRRAAETKHSSCLLFTSREKPFALAGLEGSRTPVRSLHLGQLDSDASEALLQEQEVMGSAAELERVIERYGGNPLALKIVAPTIADLFGGEISAFLENGETIFGGVRYLLQEQFARLSALEETIMLWLAILREPVTVHDLAGLLVNPPSRARLLEALDSLRGRSLIEQGNSKGSFTLHPVVLEYATTRLVEVGATEIGRGHLNWLTAHRLLLANAKEYIWQSQARLIVAPILEQLQKMYGEGSAVENRLRLLVEPLRGRSEESQGYAPANLLTLLRALRGDLSGLDLHALSFREIDLRGVDMHDTNLADTTLRNARFTEAFDAIWSMAFSQNGAYWAGGDQQGQVQVWWYAKRQLQVTWRAHHSVISAVTFAPVGSGHRDATTPHASQEQRLATGSWDGVIKMWDAPTGTLLWTSPAVDAIIGLAFSPDGRALVSGGTDGQIRVWDVASGGLRQTLKEHMGPVFCVAWSPGGKILVSAGHDAQILLWQIAGEEAGLLQPTPRKILKGHSSPVRGLAFSPDGRTLASASWDSTVKLWNMQSGALKETLSIAAHASGLVWSANGRYLASGDLDRAFWVWDIEQHKQRTTFYGTMSPVRTLAFSPDSGTLDTAHEDGSMQVWDMTSGQCIRSWRGFARTVNEVAWSPDSAQLASGGNDAPVTIWEIASSHRDATTPEASGNSPSRLPVAATPTAGNTSSREPGLSSAQDDSRLARRVPLHLLRGHKATIWGVSWNPHGRWLASCGEDNTIRIWDVVKGTSEHVLTGVELADAQLFATEWSPDGTRLAVASHRLGVLIYDTRTQTLAGVGRSDVPPRTRRVAWSPDGTHLASSNEGGSIFIWNSSDYSLRATLEGHRGMVTALAWSPDGAQLASGSWGHGNDQLFVWDTRSWKRIATLDDPNESVFAVAWSADGESVISAGSDGMLRWWNPQEGECILARQGHRGPVQALRPSPDGRLLASGGDDGAIQIWRIESGDYVTTLRRDRPYERLNITGIRGLTDAQKLTLKMMGAFEEQRSA